MLHAARLAAGRAARSVPVAPLPHRLSFLTLSPTLAASHAAVPTRAACTLVSPRSHASSRCFSASAARHSTTSYTEAMHQAWQSNPSSVDVSWRKYFESGAFSSSSSSSTSPSSSSSASSSSSSSSLAAADAKEVLDNLKVERLIRAFVVRGHHLGDLDPLGILNADLEPAVPQELTLPFYGFSEADTNRQFVVPPSPLFGPQPSFLSLGEIMEKLQSVYCQHVGAEFSHIQDSQQVTWWKDNLEKPFPGLEKEQRLAVLQGLIESAGFERFLQKKFKSEKRFGVDGCEVLIPGLQQMIKRLAAGGVEQVVMGMPHRGRLNVLANVLQKPKAAILKEFQSLLEPGEEGSGDVKYHLGMSSTVAVAEAGRSVHLTLMANPSHLEAVNPVVEGKARAEQDYRQDGERRKVVPVLLHGDASFAGQGVVPETLSLAGLKGYTTGGTIHVVVNNQVGFTTDPRFARSTPYCTDVAKFVGAPILHVNGDDTEAVVRCFLLAADYRQTFGRDVVIDLVCYRRFGHNEADNPMFTQPLMYKRITEKQNVLDIYAQELISKGVVTAEQVKQAEADYEAQCEKAFANAPTHRPKVADYLSHRWAAFRKTVHMAKIQDTGIDFDTLRLIGTKSAEYPADFAVHPQLKTILQRRTTNVAEGKELDFAACEAMAFGSLMLEKCHVRLSGQDVERGTFSHRHMVLHDQSGSGRKHVPLEHLTKEGSMAVFNSNLSEYAVLGFELGYSQANPMSLVLWEAQFGDFANTAQTIIDQFISSGEAKWGRYSGLVLLLPHGYEGMGPEHSSARMERFLQMCCDDEAVYPVMDHFARTQIERCNFQVVNCTTPANYFHILRRQVHREFRKPLVVFTPKSLLRATEARSVFADIGPGTRFLRLIPETDRGILLDPQPNPDVKRVIFCQGKVYYDLMRARTEAGLRNVAIARVEQISPFPYDLVQRQADNFPRAEVVWCQEEPRNMGAWTYVDPRIETALSKSVHHQHARARYVGRPASAATATGDKQQHKKELQAFISEALSI